QPVGVPGVDDFPPIGPEWSWVNGSGPIPEDKTPVGDRPFLGQFGNQTVRLSLDDLPSHSHLRVAFDLFTIGSWDGNVNGEFGALKHYGGDSRGDSGMQDNFWGPDIFQVSRPGIGPLFSSTFSSENDDGVHSDEGPTFDQAFNGTMTTLALDDSGHPETDASA